MNNSELPIAYQKFFQQFPEIETLEVSQWKTPHLLGYIAKKYKEHYNIDFTFRMNASAPSKAYECVQIAKLKQMISSDPQTLKDYIDWVFEKKIIERKKRIVTLAIFIDVENINFYKWNMVNAMPDRTTPLPTNILVICQSYDPTVKTYGDLAFMQQAYNTPYSNLMLKLEKANFDISILKKIK